MNECCTVQGYEDGPLVIYPTTQYIIITHGEEREWKRGNGRGGIGMGVEGSATAQV